MERFSLSLRPAARKAASPSSKFSKTAIDKGIASQDCQSNPSNVFDGITRVLCSAIPRREALRITFMGVIGVALAEAGIKTTWAAPTCLCMGQVYDPSVECCTPGGVQRKKNNTNVITACPSRVANPEYVCKPNGCGSEGGKKFPGSVGKADFLTCCGAPGTAGTGSHDCCWGKCKEDRNNCDQLFLACLDAACRTAYPGSGVVETIKRTSCQSAALTYFGAVESRLATSAYEAAQSGGCDCCGTSTCPQSCAGSSCGSLPACDPGGDCVCFTSTEGSGACVHGATPCSSVPRCSSTADCPGGSACLTTSCCGSFGVCGPLCNVITPAGPFVQSAASAQSGPTLGGIS